jgi:hypothetical protein
MILWAEFSLRPHCELGQASFGLKLMSGRAQFFLISFFQELMSWISEEFFYGPAPFMGMACALVGQNYEFFL